MITSYYNTGFYNINKWYGVILVAYSGLQIINRAFNNLMIWVLETKFETKASVFYWAINLGSFWIAPLQQAAAPIGLSSLIFL